MRRSENTQIRKGGHGYETAIDPASCIGSAVLRLRAKRGDSPNHTARKYGGEMLAKAEDGVFTLVVRLNCPVEKQQ